MSGFTSGEYFFGVCEISFRFPTIFSGGISFPFDQVGVASATSSVSQNSFNLVFWLGIVKVRWWLGEVFSVNVIVFEGG